MEFVPPTTVVGLTATALSAAGVIVTFFETEFPLNVAVMAAVVLAATPIVVIVKVACVLPAGTVTEAGTVAFALPEARVTTEPPAGAATGIMTVLAVVGLPPTTEPGLKLSVISVEVLTTRLALAVPSPVAVIVAVTSCA